jgi:hypothetical protein
MQIVAAYVGDMPGAYSVTESGLYFTRFPDGETYNVQVGLAVDARARVAVYDGELRAIVTGTGLYGLECFVSTDVPHLKAQVDGDRITCTSDIVATASWGNVSGLVLPQWDKTQGLFAYVATASGLYFYTSTSSPQLTNVWPRPIISVAFSSTLGIAAAGDHDHVCVFEREELVNCEWVTDLTSLSGGVYDGPITSMVFDRTGILYAGNEVKYRCLCVFVINAGCSEHSAGGRQHHACGLSGRHAI